MKDGLGRRSLLKLLGVSPVAAPMMGRVAAEHALQSAGPYGGPVGYPTQLSGVVAWVRASLPKAVWKALNRERDERDAQFRLRIAYRLGALEHDIAAMRSWSPAFALSQQMKRDFAHRDWMEESRHKLWPQDDDD